MQHVQMLFHKMLTNYRVGGSIQLVKFCAWLIQTYTEKLIIRILAHIPFCRLRVTFRFLKPQGNFLDPNCRLAEPTQATFVVRMCHDKKPVAMTIQSLLDQRDPRWECYLYSFGITANQDLQSIKRKYPDERIKIFPISHVDKEKQLFTEIFPLIFGNWIVVSQAGDVHDRALVETISHYSCDVLYWDEDVYRGPLLVLPFLKPDWSPELWLSVDLLRCAAFNTNVLKSILENGEEISIPSLVRNIEKYTHIPKILTHCRNAAWIDPLIVKNHMIHVQEYLEASGLEASFAQRSIGSRIGLSFKSGPGLVSIIIPTKDNLELIKRCVRSIIKTPDRASYEIIMVDNQSEDPATQRYYQRILKQYPNIRLVQSGPDFNFSRVCNIGAGKAKGEYLLFLNNDIEVISPNWLCNMIAFTGLKGVGVVGAKLLYPDGKIQHAGIVLGLEGQASHVFMGTIGTRQTPFGSVNWYRNYSAITGACMLIKKDLFTEINGFDERLGLIFNDVDLCIRAREKGYRSVYNPDVVLIHHEGKTRGKLNPEADIVLGSERFKEYICKGDPYYHPRLSRAWRVPTLKRKWEQKPGERVEKILKYQWY
jgi:GT2 family glycosyltransferase